MAKAPRKSPASKAPKKAAPRKGGAKGKSPKSSRPKSPRTQKAAAPQKAARGSYEVICSECYSEFDFNPGTSASQITCPVCMHVGQVADNTERTQFGFAKAKQSKSFRMGLIPGILMLVIGFFWLTKLNGPTELDQTMNYGLLGGTLLMFLLTIFGTVKHESARAEVYF